MRRIDWTTPAHVVEKIIEYDAVHEIRGWSDLRRRLQKDRRCYAFFHPALTDDPVIFVEVALTDELTSRIADLLDQPPPADPPPDADTAIFYSINNCLPGLRGIEFGSFLLKRVVDELQVAEPCAQAILNAVADPRFRGVAAGIGWAIRSRLAPSGSAGARWLGPLRRTARHRRRLCASGAARVGMRLSTWSRRGAASCRSIRWRAFISATVLVSSASTGLAISPRTVWPSRPECSPTTSTSSTTSTRTTRTWVNEWRDRPGPSCRCAARVASPDGHARAASSRPPVAASCAYRAEIDLVGRASPRNGRQPHDRLARCIRCSCHRCCFAEHCC